MEDIDTILQPIDGDQTFDTWMQALADEGLPSDTWLTGGPMRVALKVIAYAFAASWAVVVAAISGGFLETATGRWLTLLAFYVYGVTRTPATFASGNVVFTNAGGGMYGPFDPGAFQVYNPDTKALYTNTASFTILPSATTAPIPFQALVAGSVGTSPVGTITSLQTPQPSVTCSNPADVVGLDAQSDDDLKTLCSNKLGALSMLGPRDAYRYAMRTALVSGQPVNINRSSLSRSSSTGRVTMIIASPSGAPTAADLTAVGANIEAIARPDTATVSLAGATVATSAQALTVYAVLTAGLDVVSLTTLIEDALTALGSSYDIGGLTKPPSTQGWLYASDIVGAVKGAHASIYAVDGATDFPLSAFEVVSIVPTLDVRLVQSKAA